jgi:hypothetical protein
LAYHPSPDARPHLFACRQSNQRLRSQVSSLSRRVAADFSLDETAAARLSLGLGDKDMPGISLFAMPMADLYGSPKVRLCWCLVTHDSTVYTLRSGVLEDCLTKLMPDLARLGGRLADLVLQTSST